jgi:hypothetical protein
MRILQSEYEDDDDDDDGIARYSNAVLRVSMLLRALVQLRVACRHGVSRWRGVASESGRERERDREK